MPVQGVDMKKFWSALALSLLLSFIHFAGEEQFRSTLLSHVIDGAAILAFPGNAVAQVLGMMGRNMPHVVSSLAFVIIVSIVVNTLFYWCLFALVSAAVKYVVRVEPKPF
jgi:hypothetical protein